ncbi:hypothetical protein C8Q77DRAFT_1075668 [Trametes polyzona]|nr:hypothetical protein C8Q77DRAFT_1075668 [Trametes polyzona]
MLLQTIEGLKKTYNATSPVLRILPNEVIMEVFRCIRPTSRSDIRVAHVCSCWRAIILNTPEFWADLITSSDAPVRTEADWACFLSLLHRSFPRPYGLSLSGHGLPLMPDARRHLARITSLAISFKADDLFEHLPNLSEFLSLGLPTLEDLVLTIDQFSYDPHEHVEPDYGSRYLTSFAKFPRLHTLRTNGSLFTAALATNRLRHLTLVGGEHPFPGTMTMLEASSFPAFLATLQSCLALETLELVHTLPRYPSTPVHPAIYPPVYLERLQRLTVSDSTALIRTFLESVSFPASTRLEVHNVAPTWQSAYTDVLPQATPLPVLPLLERMSVSLDNARAQCTFRGYVRADAASGKEGEWEARLSVHTTWDYFVGDAVLADLRDVLAVPEVYVAELELGLEMDEFVLADAGQWTLLLAVFPDLVRLSVCVRRVDALVDALSGPESEDLLPCLEELAIRCWDEDEGARARLEAAMNAHSVAGYGSVHWTLVADAGPQQRLAEWEASQN